MPARLGIAPAWRKAEDGRGPGRRVRIRDASGPYAVVDGRGVINFVGAGYLGLDFGSWMKAQGARHEAGVPFGLSLPSAIAAPEDLDDLEAELATLVERPAAAVTRSTL